MIGDACNLFPVIEGKPSKLYTDLYNKTKKNRKLTNFLYALSQQDEIKNKFAPSEKNSQGEPTTKAFFEKLNIDSVLKEQDKIDNAAEELGAIDKDGETIYYETIDHIKDKVLRFNNTHDKLRATIKYDAEGFYIDVDIINAENYNTNSVLNIRSRIYDSIINTLYDAGLNTVFSDNTKVLFNPLNIYYALNQLKGLRKKPENINSKLASLIADLFANDPLIIRLKSQFGDDLAKAFSQVSGYYYRDKLEITERQETQLKNALTNISSSLKKILKNDAIDEIIEEAKADEEKLPIYGGTDSMSIRETLKELYTKYHLDQESINVLGRRVSKISEAATQLLQIQVAKLNEARLKGKAKNETKLLKAQRDVDNGMFLKGISDMLKDINNSIKTMEKKLDKLMSKIDTDPDTLKAINNISGIINEQLDLVADYSDILKSLVNNDFLENDDTLSDEDLLDSIQEVSTELLDKLTRMETNCRLKQVDVVKAFFRIYWGEKKTLPDGTEITIDQLMDTAIKDINFFDRFIYAINTTNNEQMNLIGEAVKQAQERRDAELIEKAKVIRAATSKLHSSGSSFAFIFDKDKDGYPERIISNYDYKRYYKELEEYENELKKDKDIDEEERNELLKEWETKHSRSVKYEYRSIDGTESFIMLTVPIYDAKVSVKDRLTKAQYEYYQTMIAMKADMLKQIDAVSNNDLFNVIEISNNLTSAMADAGGNPVTAYRIVKNKIVDMFKTREDDIDYGFILDANGMKKTNVNARGEEIMTLPLFYTHKIKDRSRVSTDFSRSMLAYLASSQQYVEMNKILDTLLLAKDYMMQRKIAQDSGGNILSDIHKLGKKTYATVATSAGINTSLKGLIDDFYERTVYGRLKKDEGHIWGTKIRVDKAIDALTGYTSIAGLSVNIMGAQANLLVGKLQMLIESGLGMGGEFFGVKDMMFADVKYFQLLPELLNEVNSNNKSSFLGLLMEKFDVLDDFYEKIKETGFYKSPISKIIGNTNLFFLYGIGEHLLHAQGMLAVLHNKKNNVLDKHGNEVPLIEALKVIKDDTGNGEIAIKEGYTKKTGEPITEEDLRIIKRRIAYTNKSMHGAFGQFEKGMLHRYAVGRLIMNFRQWMPAHYQRRFRGLHYDTDLQEYREGYYVSTFKFLVGCVKDLSRAKLQIAARWKDLSEMERFNLKRAIAETAIWGMLAGMIALLGDAKDHKGNWAMRDLIYQLKRMQMETMASDPFAFYGFVDNIIKLLNSPVAAVKTVERISHIVKLTDLFETIESGKYKGENRYFRNLEKDLPFYGHIIKAIEFGDSDDLFKLFN